MNPNIPIKETSTARADNIYLIPENSIYEAKMQSIHNSCIGRASQFLGSHQTGKHRYGAYEGTTVGDVLHDIFDIKKYKSASPLTAWFTPKGWFNFTAKRMVIFLEIYENATDKDPVKYFKLLDMEKPTYWDVRKYVKLKGFRRQNLLEPYLNYPVVNFSIIHDKDFGEDNKFITYSIGIIDVPPVPKDYVIHVARDFTDIPGPALRKDGPLSGEEFREKFLGPAYEHVLKTEGNIIVDLKGVYGMRGDFIEESFGKWVYETKCTWYSSKHKLILEGNDELKNDIRFLIDNYHDKVEFQKTLDAL